MKADAKKTKTWARVRALLPSEHGFWVMLGGALASALFRAQISLASVIAAGLTTVSVIAGASALHRRIRRNGAAQLLATLLLSLAAVPVELVGGVSHWNIACAALARSVVFVASALIVRAAFARTARLGAVRNWQLHWLSIAIASAGTVAFYVGGRTREALACAMTTLVCAVFAYRRPTVKELKLLGLTLSGLIIASVTALAA